MANLCYVKGKITPEHRIHSKYYNIECIINEEDETAEKCECLDCAAAQGGCKHAISMLMWLYRRTEEPSVTSVECYWKSSKMGTVEKTSRLADICGKTAPPLPVIPPGFLSKVLTKGSALNCEGTLFQPLSRDILSLTSVHYNTKNGDITPTVFIQNMSDALNENACEMVECQTRNQADSSLWQEVRYGRITASSIYEASRCRTDAGSFIEKIFGGCKPLMVEAVQRGKRLEKDVLRAVEQTLKIKIDPCGIYLRKDYPMFGAHLDGITKTHCVEVKCPMKNTTIKNFIENGVLTPKCYAQVQLQMLMSKRTKAYFCVASPDFEAKPEADITAVYFDVDFHTAVLQKAKDFWIQCIYPKLKHLNKFTQNYNIVLI